MFGPFNTSKHIDTVIGCILLRSTEQRSALLGARTFLGLSAVDKEDSQAEQTVPSQETACFPTKEAVITVSHLINPRVSCYCTLPAIWPSQQNPAGHSSTPHALPDTLKAVGCLPVERQILNDKPGCNVTVVI